MNYLLVLGLALFSSASGALLVALLHISRSEPSRTFVPSQKPITIPGQGAGNDDARASRRQSAAAGTALVLCKDAPTRQLIIESLQPLAILRGDLRRRSLSRPA